MSAEVRKPLQLTILDPKRSLNAPNALAKPLIPHLVKKGTLPISAQGIASSSSMPGPSNHSSASSSHLASNEIPLHSILESLSRKRTIESLPEPARQQDPKKRKARSCKKCGKEDCKGRREVKSCLNLCQDCKKHACKGRDSKRPSKKCWENEENA